MCLGNLDIVIDLIFLSPVVVLTTISYIRLTYIRVVVLYQASPFELRAYIAITRHASHGHATLKEMIVVETLFLPGLAPFAWFLFQNSSVHHVVEVEVGKYSE